LDQVIAYFLMLVALVITYMFHWFFIFPFLFLSFLLIFVEGVPQIIIFLYHNFLNIINEILEIFFDTFPSYGIAGALAFFLFFYLFSNFPMCFVWIYFSYMQVMCNHIKRKKFVNESIIFFYYFFILSLSLFIIANLTKH
jgi:hypothetical protein